MSSQDTVIQPKQFDRTQSLSDFMWNTSMAVQEFESVSYDAAVLRLVPKGGDDVKSQYIDLNHCLDSD